MKRLHQMDPKIDALIEELIEMQKKRLLSCGHSILPNLVQDDLLQPNDFPELELHPLFRYEEGLLIGMQTVQSALRALRNEER